MLKDAIEIEGLVAAAAVLLLLVLAEVGGQ